MKKTLILLLTLLIILAVSGCTGFRIPLDEKGKEIQGIDVYGFGKDFTMKIEYYKPGKGQKIGAMKSRAVSSNSRFKDYLLGLNTLFDTGMEFWNKAKL